ncbi:Protein CBG27413 [Caenorhabditis briggsae]|uniref:Protein CBG27413 n=1 Tax=Caenorhabditis briggsae TaxID=6238 RepID=B6IJZ0_CAEBR|nr:Protein CBG27413 [Caenorhabditis briggsae]CAS00220.1 Protein CBG27413 [Caenorhabditis briggsae]
MGDNIRTKRLGNVWQYFDLSEDEVDSDPTWKPSSYLSKKTNIIQQRVPAMNGTKKEVSNSDEFTKQEETAENELFTPINFNSIKMVNDSKTPLDEKITAKRNKYVKGSTRLKLMQEFDKKQFITKNEANRISKKLNIGLKGRAIYKFYANARQNALEQYKLGITAELPCQMTKIENFFKNSSDPTEEEWQSCIKEARVNTYQGPAVSFVPDSGAPDGFDLAWNQIYNEELNALTSFKEELFMRTVFLLMHYSVARYNQNPGNDGRIGLIPIEWSTRILMDSKCEENDLKKNTFFWSLDINICLLPFHFNDHYILVKLNISANKADLFDSLPTGKENPKVPGKIKKAIWVIANALGMNEPRIRRQLCNFQKDSHSCGVFAVANCEEICGLKRTNLSSNRELNEKREKFKQQILGALNSGEYYMDPDAV